MELKFHQRQELEGELQFHSCLMLTAQVLFFVVVVVVFFAGFNPI